MATTTLAIQSMGVYAVGPPNDIATTGSIWSGMADVMASPANASAVRFALPADFDSAFDVSSAVLNLYIRYFDSGNDPQRHTIGVLAANPQNIPSPGSAIYSASVGSNTKTIGYGTYSPALNYVLTNTATWRQIDITDAVNEARAAGRLSGGYIVVMFKPVNYAYGAYIGAPGSGVPNSATLDLDYASNSPPPDEIAEAEDGQTISEGDEPQATFSWLAIPEDSQTESEGSEPQPYGHWDLSIEDAQTASEATEPQCLVHLTLGTPEASQTKSEASEPNAAIESAPIESQTLSLADEPQVNIDGYPQAGQTRSLADSPQVVSFWAANPEDSGTASEAEEPQPVLDGEEGELVARCGCLFPSDLFPHDLMV